MDNGYKSKGLICWKRLTEKVSENNRFEFLIAEMSEYYQEYLLSLSTTWTMNNFNSFHSLFQCCKSRKTLVMFFKESHCYLKIICWMKHFAWPRKLFFFKLEAFGQSMKRFARKITQLSLLSCAGFKLS